MDMTLLVLVFKVIYHSAICFSTLFKVSSNADQFLYFMKSKVPIFSFILFVMSC